MIFGRPGGDGPVNSEKAERRNWVSEPISLLECSVLRMWWFHLTPHSHSGHVRPHPTADLHRPPARLQQESISSKFLVLFFFSDFHVWTGFKSNFFYCRVTCVCLSIVENCLLLKSYNKNALLIDGTAQFKKVIQNFTDWESNLFSQPYKLIQIQKSGISCSTRYHGFWIWINL